MRRLTLLALGVILFGATAPRAVAAQEAQQSGSFFKKPVFLLMPGLIATPVISGIGDDDIGLYGGSDTKAYFNARFMTVIPTELPWFQLVAGTQFQPNFTTISGVKSNFPNIFYGAIIPVPGVAKATDGWLGLSLDPLGLYSAGGGGSSLYPYGHDFVLEGALVINVGQKMMPRMGMFSGSSVYVLLDQIMTHSPITQNGDRDRWWPILLAGVAVPIGG
jgi:hypothetical protein